MSAPPIAECRVCGGDAAATGPRKLQADTGRTLLEMECNSCHSVFDVWRREWEADGHIPKSPGYDEWSR